MDPRTDPVPLDWRALERTLHRRACWHEDPAAYRQGVDDALAAVRAGLGDDRHRPAHVAVAG